MKTTIFNAIFALLAILPVKAFPSFSVMGVEDKKDIELDGKTETEIEKSLFHPFKAYQEENQEVCVISYDTYSTVTIRILDANGHTMDYYTSGLLPLQIISFDISNYPNGIYSLVITTPQDTYLTGVFEVN